MMTVTQPSLAHFLLFANNCDAVNCPHHPNQVAIVVYCQGCGQAMCWECSQQASGIQNQFCSEQCAGTVSRQPGSRAQSGDIFQRICATVFLTVLLAIGGGAICTLGAQWAINVKSDEVKIEKFGGNLEHEFHSPFNLFFYTGITDWKAQFAMGATVGVGAALLYFRKNYGKLKSKL